MRFNAIKMGLLTLGAFSVGAAAIAASPADTVSARKANFKVMGKSMKAISEELKKPAPDVALIRKGADAIAQASTKVKGAFPKGTGPDSGVRTEALADIWAKPADFGKAADRLTGAAQGFQIAAKSGDLAKIKAAFPGVGGSCKGCHDAFKGHD